MAAFLVSGSALADGFLLGAGIDGDTANGRAVTAFGNFSLGDRTWLTAGAGAVRTDGYRVDNRTRSADIAIDHEFGVLGARVGAAYWGDPDVLDSRDVRGTVYLRGNPGSIAVDYEQRRFEFDLQSDQLRGRTVGFDADGWGATARLRIGDHIGLHAGGMRYDYSRNIRIEPEIDTLSFLTLSRLSTIRSLLNHELRAGIEFEFGLRSIDFVAERFEVAMDGSRVDSLSAGFLTPLSERTDLEVRLSIDDSELFGKTTGFSLYLYYFGGS